jgi:PhnB protein
MSIVTTLDFAGRTEEALRFYAEALRSETVFLMRFKDCPDPTYARAGMEGLIFHATFRIEGTEFMASDVGYVQGRAPALFSGFALALKLGSARRAQRIFAALREDGRVVIPLEKSTFTGWYGIVVDRFGVCWKINVEVKKRR